MYACFGFAFARLRRARTIEPAMPVAFSLSSFLLRSVCPSVCLTVVSDAIHWPARLQNRSEIVAKIHRKSIPEEASGHSKSMGNRSQDRLGTLRGAQGRLEGVSGASRERPGASPARPGSARRIPKGTPGHQKERLRASRSAPRRPKSTPSHVRERKIQVFLARFAPRPIFDRFSLDFRSIFGCSRKSFGERSRSKFRSTFGSSAQSLTLTKHRP